AQASPLRASEGVLIEQALQDAQGNVTRAARALGISRATMYRKLGARRPRATT
ncbi:histidine kinase, partial [Delftia sp. BR1]